jgi:hypothetical protein
MMSEAIPKFKVLDEDELSKVDPKNFFVRLTIEFGPEANISEKSTQEELLAFYQEHGKHGDNNPAFFHVLMSFLRDYQAFCWNNNVPIESESPTKLVLTLGACSKNCRPSPVLFPDVYGEIVYPSLCVYC